MNYFLFFIGAILFGSGALQAECEYCAFCDCAVLEKQTFFEDECVLALYTHKPVTQGHCLIIPKRHVERFEDLSEREAAHIFQTIKKVHQAVVHTFHTSSYLLLQKNGKEAGQSVPHVHFHYIPREDGETSALKFMYKMYAANMKKPMDPQKMEQIICILRQAMQQS